MKTLDGFLIGVIGGLVGGFITYLAIKEGELNAQEKFLASLKAERETNEAINKANETLNMINAINKDLDDICVGYKDEFEYLLKGEKI